MLLKRIDQLTSIEDAIDYFRGKRSKIKTKQSAIQERLEILENRKERLDDLIKFLEKSDKFGTKPSFVDISTNEPKKSNKAILEERIEQLKKMKQNECVKKIIKQAENKLKKL